MQHELFDLGGELSIPGHSAMTAAHVEQRLEHAVEVFDAALPSLKEWDVLWQKGRASGAPAP